MTKSRFPHSLVLIFSMIVVAQVAAVLLPSGRYETEPKPSAGETYAEVEGAVPLRERLAAAREARSLSQADVAALFAVSEDTVRGWEVGPPDDEGWKPGTHIESGAGALIAAWIETGDAPSRAEIADWKASVDARTRVVPGTYHEVPKEEDQGSALLQTGKALHGQVQEPIDAAVSASARATTRHVLAGADRVFLAIPKGLEAGAEIIFFVFIVGGVIGLLRATGAIDALIGMALHLLGGRPVWLVAGMVTLLAIGSSTIGMAEEYMPFIPILVTMCIALKLDAIVAMAIIYVGAGIGYGAAAVNPFTVLIAQDIAGVEPTSGWEFRAVFMVACLVVGVWHIMRYARRIQNDPERSLVRDIDYSEGFDMPEDVRLTFGRVVVLASIAVAIVVFVWGVATRDWYFNELNVVFLVLGGVGMLFGAVSPNRAAQSFCAGAAEMTTTALLIGFARGIQVVLDDGVVIDTVIHGISQFLEGTSAEVSAVGMLAVQSICNFFIPSGSGQAYVTMPIMAPLADLTGVSRQTAVLAYQMGDGFTNMLVPTNALLMGMLALGKIPFQRWLRFVLPLMAQLFLLSVLALVVATWIGL